MARSDREPPEPMAKMTPSHETLRRVQERNTLSEDEASLASRPCMRHGANAEPPVVILDSDASQS